MLLSNLNKIQSRAILILGQSFAKQIFQSPSNISMIHFNHPQKITTKSKLLLGLAKHPKSRMYQIQAENEKIFQIRQKKTIAQNITKRETNILRLTWRVKLSVSSSQSYSVDVQQSGQRSSFEGTMNLMFFIHVSQVSFVYFMEAQNQG